MGRALLCRHRTGVQATRPPTGSAPHLFSHELLTVQGFPLLFLCSRSFLK